MLLKERAGHKKCRNKCDAQPLSYILIPILPQYMWSPGFVQLSGLPPSSRLLANILCLFTPDLRILDGGLPTKVQSVPVLPWPQDNASSVQIRSASGLLGWAKHSVQNFIFLRYSPNAQRCHFRVANKIPEVSTLAGPLRGEEKEEGKNYCSLYVFLCVHWWRL